MAWCAAPDIAYVLGLAKNGRLLAAWPGDLAQAPAPCAQTGPPARVCTAFRYRTRESGTQERRGVAQAAQLEKGAPPRFVGTSLPPPPWAAPAVDEALYWARGDMENRSQEPHLDLAADRPSTATRWANPIRRSFSSGASLLRPPLRRLGLHGTEMAQAQCGTIRLRLCKSGALLPIRGRRMQVALASGYPYAPLLQQVYAQLGVDDRGACGLSLFDSQTRWCRALRAKGLRRGDDGARLGQFVLCPFDFPVAPPGGLGGENPG
jgi:hypothetical protein